MNASILSSLAHALETEKNIQENFLLNGVANASPTTPWAAHKATIRGKLIQVVLRLRKSRRADIKMLEQDLLFLNKQHKHSPTSVLVEELDSARTALNLALTAIAEKSLHWSGAYFYHQRDKMGSLLAAILTPKLKTHTPYLTSNSDVVLFHKIPKRTWKLSMIFTGSCIVWRIQSQTIPWNHFLAQLRSLRLKTTIEIE